MFAEKNTNKNENPDSNWRIPDDNLKKIIYI